MDSSLPLPPPFELHDTSESAHPTHSPHDAVDAATNTPLESRGKRDIDIAGHKSNDSGAGAGAGAADGAEDVAHDETEQRSRLYGEAFSYHYWRAMQQKLDKQKQEADQGQQPQQQEQIPEQQPESKSKSKSQSQAQSQAQSQSQPRRRQLTRDQRRDILLLRRLGYKHFQIAEQLGLTTGSVQYTCNTRRASPQRRPGRTRILTDSRLSEIESFITASVPNRQLSYAQLLETVGLADVVKEDTLTVALRRRGFVRRMAFLRSPLAPAGSNRTAKPIQTWLTCRKDEEDIDSPEVLRVVVGGGGGKG